MFASARLIVVAQKAKKKSITQCILSIGNIKSETCSLCLGDPSRVK